MQCVPWEEGGGRGALGRHVQDFPELLRVIESVCPG